MWMCRRATSGQRQWDTSYTIIRRRRFPAARGLPSHYVQWPRLGDASTTAEQEENYWTEVPFLLLPLLILPTACTGFSSYSNAALPQPFNNSPTLFVFRRNKPASFHFWGFITKNLSWGPPDSGKRSYSLDITVPIMVSASWPVRLKRLDN